MKNKILLLFVAIALLVSCQKSDIEVFSDDNAFLNFEKTSFGYIYPDLTNFSDSVFCSTIFSPKVNGVRPDMDIKLSVVLSGTVSNVDRTYEVDFDSAKSRDLVEGVHFTLKKERILKAGEKRDTVVVTFHCEQIEADNITDGRLYIRLKPNANFDRGVELYQYFVLKMYGDTFPESHSPDVFYYPVGPAWIQAYIGYKMIGYYQYYSPMRLQTFVEVNRMTDQGYRFANQAELYSMGKKYAEYLEANAIYEDVNGTPVRITANGTVKYK